MSKTYHMACDQCRHWIWIGQDAAGKRDRFFIYGGNRAFPQEGEKHSPLAEFLFTHHGHPLRFLDDEEVCDLDEYREVDSQPGLPLVPDGE